ncbi:U1 small nuclear ribonucleoprotein C [Pteropus alecto]|uniref:U1 small nuclear ribonucleoprotein C n=1 Tax=Pteropus alecto TaxID=9402 RepID=L5KPJ8_PTEAL|nr:U1 small nuclear ribonucleoprotein C [Pteropus alecto]
MKFYVCRSSACSQPLQVQLRVKIALTKISKKNKVANGLQSNMLKFYCDYCDTYLTHDPPSVRKTHCNGRRHKENVKVYYQKRIEEQAQSLIEKTTVAFQQGKMPPIPFSAPPPARAMIPPPPSLPGPSCPGMMLAP